jgi:hypothetical protein
VLNFIAYDVRGWNACSFWVRKMLVGKILVKICKKERLGALRIFNRHRSFQVMTVLQKLTIFKITLELLDLFLCLKKATKILNTLQKMLAQGFSKCYTKLPTVKKPLYSRSWLNRI